MFRISLHETLLTDLLIEHLAMRLAEDAFAAIALRCGVAAETEEVGDFLVATQCVLRRSTKTVGAVVSRMKELEKR